MEDNGGIDIGVFGDLGRLGEHGGEDLVQMIVDMLSI